jgi:hypothetical protein
VFSLPHFIGSLRFALAPRYLITLSARASTFGGTDKPICFAVPKFIASSNFVGCYDSP